MVGDCFLICPIIKGTHNIAANVMAFKYALQYATDVIKIYCENGSISLNALVSSIVWLYTRHCTLYTSCIGWFLDVITSPSPGQSVSESVCSPESAVCFNSSS